MQQSNAVKVETLGTFYKKQGSGQIKFVPAGPLTYTLRINYNAVAAGDYVQGREEGLSYSKVGKVAGCMNAKDQLDRIFKKAINLANVGN